MTTQHTSSAMPQRMVPQIVTWRSLLGSILRDHPEEMERLTKELDVKEITITRWTRNAVTPKYPTLLRLYQLLPDYQEQLLPLIRADFPDFLLTENLDAQLAEQSIAPVISPTFYRDVLELLGQASDRTWQVCELIFDKALNHLAHPLPRVGMELNVVLCMPPSEDGNIYSLRVALAMGTDPPWDLAFHRKNLLLGSESLAGYAVSGRVGVIVPDMEKENIYPFHQVPHEQSAAAFPLLRENLVAGSLVVSCTERDYLQHPGRVALMKAYSQLVSLAVKDADFYPSDLISLEPMPLWDVQQLAWATFRTRVIRERQQTDRNGHPSTIQDIEHQVRRQIEKEFRQKTKLYIRAQ